MQRKGVVVLDQKGYMRILNAKFAKRVYRKMVKAVQQQMQ